jgi:phage tail-like protein
MGNSSGRREDPYRNFRFIIEIDGTTAGGFSEANIPDSTNETVDNKNGPKVPQTKELKNLTKIRKLILRRGIMYSMELCEWRKLVQQGELHQAKKNIVVTLRDEKGNQATKIKFVKTWPTKYEITEPVIKGKEIAIETLELSYQIAIIRRS